jgi:hypothetical protein
VRVRPLLFVLFFLLAALSTTGVHAQTPQHAQSPELSGFWVGLIPNASQILPCADGKRAWVWSRSDAGVRLVGLYGEIVHEHKELSLGSDAVLSGPACDLWVRQVEGVRVVLQRVVLEANGVRVTKVMLPEGELPEGEGWSVLEPVEGRSEAWVGSHNARRLAKEEGGQLVLTPVRPIEGGLFFSIAGTTRAWVASKPIAMGILHKDPSQQLRMVDGASGVERRIELPLGFAYALRAGDKRALWIASPSTPLGLYLIDEDGHSRGPILKKPFGTIVPVAGERRAWVVTRGGVYLVNPDERGTHPDKPLTTERCPRVEADAGARRLWCFGDTGVVLLDTAHPERALRLLDGVKLTFRNLTVVGDRTWLPEKGGHQWYIIEADGQVRGKGRPVITGPERHPIAVTADGSLVVMRSTTPDGARFSVFNRDGRHLGELGGQLRAGGSTGLSRLGPWFNVAENVYVVRPMQDVKSASLRLGGHDAQSQRTLPLTDWSRDNAVEVRVDWPGKVNAVRDNGRFKLMLFDRSTRSARDTLILQVGHGSALGSWPARPKTDTAYDIIVRYEDDVGSRFEAVWQNVTFHEAWFARRWARTTALFVGLLLCFALLFKLGSATGGAGRWLPFFAWAVSQAGGLGVRAWLDKHTIDATLLSGLLGGSLLLFVGTGMVTPAVFRILASTAPFDRLAPLAFLIPWSRKRLLAGYAKFARSELVEQRKLLGEVEYVPSPAVVLDSRDASRRTVDSPAVVLSGILSSPLEKRADVLIECPGGRGKSALVRQIVWLLLESFHKNRNAPLPVVCRGPATSVESMVTEALGRHLYDPKLIDPLLRGGHLVVVMDGLTESGIEPRVFDTFVRGDAGGLTRLVAAARPHDGFRAALRRSDALLEVDPQRLDETNLGRFVETYRKASGQGSASPLSEGLRRICRGPDGTYLPILVRLALFPESDDAGSIGDVYANAVDRTLRSGNDSDPVFVGQTAALCVDTYWKTGVRTLGLRGQPEPRLTLLRRLTASGLLVPIPGGELAGSDPREVRFFHDSLQSYLTALGLFQRDDWSVLSEAAGRSEFVDADGKSELFDMCVEVFRPREQLKATLHADVQKWTVEFDGGVLKDDVIAAMPPELRPKVAERFPQGSAASAGTVLKACLELSAEHDDAAGVKTLLSLYIRVAPLIVVARKKRAEARARGNAQNAPQPPP